MTLDMSDQEYAALEDMVKTLNTRTKARAMRQALRFYKRVVALKKQGFFIQAIKGGILKQFPDLDDPVPEDVPIRRPPQK